MILALETTKKSKKIIAALTLTFLFGLILGVIAYPFLREETKQFALMLKDLIISDDKPLTALKIFLKNTEASLITLILGPTIILPFLIILANGFAAGLVGHMANEKGKSIGIIILSLLPHGIIELLAFFLAAALGMNITLAIIRPPQKGRKRISAAAEAIKKAAVIYITAVLPLLLAAAIIETYISTQIIQ